MKVTIHQPEHMPWLGFFHKISVADVYIVLDNVQYRRRYFQNRNKIRTNKGWQWIIAPIEKSDRDSLLIKDVRIFREEVKCREKNTQSIYSCYSKAPYFETYWEDFEKIYSRDYQLLIDLNLDLLHFFFAKLDIKPNIISASSLGVEGEKGDLMLNLCKAVGATTYISGISGREYLDAEQFQTNNIELVFQKFHHPIYRQLYEPFISCMSTIDLLFNHGLDSLNIIKGIGVPTMEEVFK